MASTDPWNIPLYDGSYKASLKNLLNTMANALNTALTALKTDVLATSQVPVAGTPSYASGWSDDGSTQLNRIGRSITLNLATKKSSNMSAIDRPITLPEGFRPPKNVLTTGDASGTNAPVMVAVAVNPQGVVTAFVPSGTVERVLNMSVTFIAAAA